MSDTYFSVRNGAAGRPSLLARFDCAVPQKTNRTTTGLVTESLTMTTVGSSISAVAERNVEVDPKNWTG